MHRACAAALLACLTLPAAARAQPWRPFEVDVPEELANAALERERRAAEGALRLAPPEPPAESLGEAWSRLERLLARVSGASVAFGPDRLRLSARVSVSVVFDQTWLDLRFDLAPRVLAPNVIALEAVSGSKRWGRLEEEALDDAGLPFYLSRLVEQMNQGPGEAAGLARLERGRGGAPPRVVVDLSGLPALAGTELLELRARQGVVTLVGRTSRERLALDLGAAELNEGLRALRGADGVDGLDDLNALLGPGSWLDVGREVPGRIVLHSTADLPWLPRTDYQAVFALERVGPQRLRLTLEDVRLGGPRLDGFLRSRAGAGIKRWLLRKVYQRLDRAERAVGEAYARGDLHLCMSHDPARPEVRTIDLRPGWAGAAQVRPGFELEDVRVEPGRVAVVARLSEGELAPSGARGLVGALGN